MLEVLGEQHQGAQAYTASLEATLQAAKAKLVSWLFFILRGLDARKGQWAVVCLQFFLLPL